MSDQVVVTNYPICDLCAQVGAENTAYADARIPGYGSWGYVCHQHFIDLKCEVGTGKGQRLITKEDG